VIKNYPTPTIKLSYSKTSVRNVQLKIELVHVHVKCGKKELVL
jgi:hypothetical protein